MEEVVKKFLPDVVVHLAARTDLNGQALDDYSSNILGVEVLIAVIKGCSSIKRVLFASSMYVCRPGYKPEGNLDYEPHTIYGESKVESEQIIRGSDLDVPWVIFRPTSIWGPWFGEPYSDFFNIVLNGKYFHMGDKACKKTYGYIENTVRQIESLIEADTAKIKSKVFYLGDWPEYDISEWADEIAKEINKKIISVPFVFFRFGAWFGDFLKVFGVKFPMTSFRLKNMTTDNVHDLQSIMEFMPTLAVCRKDGVKRTIHWIDTLKN